MLAFVFAIPTSLDSFLSFYPLVTKTKVRTKEGTDRTIVKLRDPAGSLKGELSDWATLLINKDPSYTTCCMQMSHAINMAFLGVNEGMMIGSKSFWRTNHNEKIKSVANRRFYYIASVNEMKDFLDKTFEPGVEVKSKDDIDGQKGIVVFMEKEWAGKHTEVWTGDNFHQGWMRGNFASLTKPKVWFWGMGSPPPLYEQVGA